MWQTWPWLVVSIVNAGDPHVVWVQTEYTCQCWRYNVLEGCNRKHSKDCVAGRLVTNRENISQLGCHSLLYHLWVLFSMEAVETSIWHSERCFRNMQVGFSPISVAQRLAVGRYVCVYGGERMRKFYIPNDLVAVWCLSTQSKEKRLKKILTKRIFV